MENSPIFEESSVQIENSNSNHRRGIKHHLYPRKDCSKTTNDDMLLQNHSSKVLNINDKNEIVRYKTRLLKSFSGNLLQHNVQEIEQMVSEKIILEELTTLSDSYKKKPTLVYEPPREGMASLNQERVLELISRNSSSFDRAHDHLRAAKHSLKETLNKCYPLEAEKMLHILAQLEDGLAVNSDGWVALNDSTSPVALALLVDRFIAIPHPEKRLYYRLMKD